MFRRIQGSSGFFKFRQIKVLMSIVKGNTKKVFWIEKFGLWEVLIFLAAGLFYAIKVNYDENNVSSAARYSLALLRKLNPYTKFSPVHLSLDKTDRQGYSLNYRMESDLDDCLERFCNNHIPHESGAFKKMLKSYLSSFLFYRVTFITMVSYCAERDDIKQNVLYLTYSLFNSIITDFYSKRGFVVWQSLPNFKTVKYCIRPWYFLSRIIFTKCIKKHIRQTLNTRLPSIWIEYAHRQSMDFSFWREMVDKSKFEIAYYFDRRDDPPLHEATSAVERKGLKWIDLHFSSLLKAADVTLKEAKGLLEKLLRSNTRLPYWFQIFTFEYSMRFLLFKKVYERFKVKILIQHQEFAWTQQVQVDALDAVNGIMIGFHWSHFPYTREPHHITPEHVYFVWGEAKKEWVEKKGNSCRFILPAGLWFVNEKDIRQGREQDGLLKSVKFMIAIFDSSVAYNIYQSPETLSTFYLRILALVERNVEWGAIVKSKNWDIEGLLFLPDGKDIVNKIKTLTKEGRLCFFERTMLSAKAASYANLSVCYNLNSAGIVAGICGFRAIHWDYNGWQHNPLCREGRQRIIFTDFDDFERAIIKVSQGNKEIGDFSPWRKRFNHFEDFSASQRVGRFVQSFMEKACNGVSSDPLASAVREYIVENKIDEDFFSVHDWWGNE